MWFRRKNVAPSSNERLFEQPTVMWLDFLSSNYRQGEFVAYQKSENLATF